MSVRPTQEAIEARLRSVDQHGSVDAPLAEQVLFEDAPYLLRRVRELEDALRAGECCRARRREMTDRTDEIEAQLIEVAKKAIPEVEEALGVHLDAGSFFVGAIAVNLIREGIEALDYFKADAKRLRETIQKLREENPPDWFRSTEINSR